MRPASRAAADLLFEIGTEEIPARFLPRTRMALRDAALQRLPGARLADPQEQVVETYATPRRLVLIFKGVFLRQPDMTGTVSGPPRAQAFDPAGKPTPALEGFARKAGVAVNELREIQTEKGLRMGFERVVKGKSAEEVLPGILEDIVRRLDCPKAMRWPQAPGLTFARPIRWLLCLHGRKPISVTVGEVRSAPYTRGRRFVHPKPIPVASSADYLKVMAKAGILVDAGERRALIRREADRLAAKAGGRVLWDEDLLSEVADLVEAPVAVLGSFPAEVLDVPQPVIVAAMEDHQRYFPVVDTSGKLLSHFVTVANGVATRSVVAGNERVLKARLADARFFWSTDTKKKLEDFLPALGTVVWQANAGTMLDKAKRVERLSRVLAMYYKALKVLPDIDHEGVGRAGLLAKADLVTAMVGEFPGLQGVVGGLYAEASGEPPAVVRGVAEHYRPVGPADDIPQSDEACLVALADKLDHLAGHFRLGHAPTGTADPFGLRRAAIGIIRILSEKGWRLPMSLSALLGVAASEHVDRETLAAEIIKAAKATEPLPPIDLGTRKVAAAAHTFIRGRLEAVFEEQGFQHDEIQAALVDFEDVVYATRRLKALVTLRMQPGFRETMLALSRVTNIIPRDYAADPARTLPDIFNGLDAAEQELAKAWGGVATGARELAEAGEFEKLYALLATMKPAIDSFFDRVLVMDPDESVRRRRLDLLKTIEGTIRLFVDVRALVLA